MVSHIITHPTFVRVFKQPETCHLEEVFSFFVQDYLYFLIVYIILIQQLSQIVLRKGFERTTIQLTNSWRCLIDNFIATPRLIVSLLTLLPKHMSNIISIVLLKLLCVHTWLLCKLLLPEQDCLIKTQTQTFNKKSQLQSSKMLQMVLILKANK